VCATVKRYFHSGLFGHVVVYMCNRCYSYYMTYYDGVMIRVSAMLLTLCPEKNFPKRQSGGGRFRYDAHVPTACIYNHNITTLSNFNTRRHFYASRILIRYYLDGEKIHCHVNDLFSVKICNTRALLRKVNAHFRLF